MIFFFDELINDFTLLRLFKKKTIVIYLQSECIEKCQVEVCSKYDREYDFEVILGKVLLC